MKKSEQIRGALKEIGCNQKMVTVKDRPGGYSWGITITIRSAEVEMSKVEEVASKFESVDRCPVTHEILSGGNTYVHIRTTEEVQEIWAAPLMPAVEKAMEDLKPSYGNRINERFILFLSGNGNFLQIHDEKSSWFGHDFSLGDAKGIALAIALKSKKQA